MEHDRKRMEMLHDKYKWFEPKEMKHSEEEFETAVKQYYASIESKNLELLKQALPVIAGDIWCVDHECVQNVFSNSFVFSLMTEASECEDNDVLSWALLCICRMMVVSEDIQWITPHLNSDGSMEAIILPQSATPYRDGAGLLRIANSETEVLYDAPKQTDEGLALATFEPGKQTSFRLSIKQPDPDVANRTLWIYGVNAPDFPGKENIPTYPMYTTQFPAGQWFRLDWAMAECQYLTWAEGCGWYDCNKSVRYNENDRNLC